MSTLYPEPKKGSLGDTSVYARPIVRNGPRTDSMPSTLLLVGIIAVVLIGGSMVAAFVIAFKNSTGS